MRRRTLGLVAGSVSILGLWLVWPNADPAPRRMAPVPPSAVAPPDDDLAGAWTQSVTTW
jgi:hypothetical protein